MVRYLLQLNANVNIETNVSSSRIGYLIAIVSLLLVVQLMFTPLHSAAQQGHVMIVKLLLEHGASPNKTNKVRIRRSIGEKANVLSRSQHGMTALSIAQRLGYISVVEELKVVTETTIASKHELITEERYKVNERRRHQTSRPNDSFLADPSARSFARRTSVDRFRRRNR